MLNNSARRRVTRSIYHAALHVLIDLARFSIQSGPLYHVFDPPKKALGGLVWGSDEDVTSLFVYWFMQQPKEFFAVSEWDGCFCTHRRACILLT